MRGFLIAIAGAFILMAAPAFAGDTMVKVGHNRLEPATVTVAVGSKVTFINEDEMPGGHSVAAEDGSFQSPPLSKDEKWSHTFDKAGTYAYSIEQHPSAKGTITVK